MSWQFIKYVHGPNHTIVSKSLHYDLHLGKLISVVLLRRGLAGCLNVCLNKALSGRCSLQLLQTVPPLSFRQIDPGKQRKYPVSDFIAVHTLERGNKNKGLIPEEVIISP